MAQRPAIDPADGWDTALAAALIGADRAPPRAQSGLFSGLEATGAAGGDLLARIGAFGTYHLAGSGLASGVLAPIEPFASVGPDCPPAAAARLVALFEAGSARAGMIEEWCEIAAAGGYRVPPELLPAIGQWRGTNAAEAATEAVAGPELAWLNRVCGDTEEAEDPDGEAARGETPADLAAPTGGADWTAGNAPARRRAFAAFRHSDPAGARVSLEAAFRSEKAEMRAALVSLLEIGLDPADEAFLESCLDDRAGGVRGAAQRLLPRLPTSRFMQRMHERVAGALRIAQKRHMLVGTRHELTVTLPDAAPALARDGIEPSPYGSRQGGPKADLLRQMLRVAPLSAFADHPPQVWIVEALKSDWSEPILDGLVAAQWRERDPVWRDALIATLREACAQKIAGVKLSRDLQSALARTLAALPPAEWEATVQATLRSKDLDLTLQTLQNGPDAFSPGFTEALLDWLAFVTRSRGEWLKALYRSGVVTRLGHRCAPSLDSEAMAAAILSRLPEESDTYLRHQLTTMSETLSLRAAMRREFSPA